MKETVSKKQLVEKLLDVESHGLTELKRIIIPLIILHVSLNPQTATIFIIEYFKVDPTMALQIVQYSLPLLVGISIARIIGLLWIFPLRYVFPYVVIAILSPFYWLLRFGRSEHDNKFNNRLNNWINCYEEKVKLRNIQKQETGLEREIFFVTRGSAIIIIFALYFAHLFDNPIGKLWNPDFNKKLMIITNVHYYCQMTGNYNVDQCKEWKVSMAENNRKLSAQTPDK